MNPATPRPSMRLLGWKPMVKSSLRGFADIELPNGRIREIPIVSSNGKYWATSPSKPLLDREGEHVEIGGKRQYAAILEWRSCEPDSLSAHVVELVRQTHPDALNSEGEP